VLLASLALLLLFWQWRLARAHFGACKPERPYRAARSVLDRMGRRSVFNLPGGSLWLFGLKQAYRYLKGLPNEPTPFKTPVLYKMVRHPLYLGFIIAFWSTPAQ